MRVYVENGRLILDGESNTVVTAKEGVGISIDELPMPVTVTGFIVRHGDIEIEGEKLNIK